MSGSANPGPGHGKPIVYSDITELVDDLAAISDLPPEKITENIFRDLGEKIQANARARAPYRTGKLRDSIEYKIEKNRLIVAAGVPYAKYMEFGTASRGEFGGSPYIIRPRSKPYLVFQIDGRWIRTKKVVHPGVAPRPFMRPATEEAMGMLSDKLAERGAMMILKGPKDV